MFHVLPRKSWADDRVCCLICRNRNWFLLYQRRGKAAVPLLPQGHWELRVNEMMRQQFGCGPRQTWRDGDLLPGEMAIFYQERSKKEETPFILLWSTPWMVEKLTALGHQSTVSVDSTFGTNMYEVRGVKPFYSFVKANHDISELWNANAYVYPEVFPGIPINLCLWHVRRAMLMQLHSHVRSAYHVYSIQGEIVPGD
ncbi:hypothetical protein R1flu_020786 [Riccia fluitans]|uniref:Transposase n=1 Tax=Riccia fluitans TaxID=41844 RepID=A0ABD1ZMI6_9MARC